MLRKYWIWIVVVLALSLGIGWLATGDQRAYARIATTYAAKQACSCVHVAGRPLASCIADFPPEAQGLITVSQQGETMRADVLFGAISAKAIHEEGFGCRIVS